jgi:hypothetical protein
MASLAEEEEEEAKEEELSKEEEEATEDEEAADLLHPARIRRTGRESETSLLNFMSRSSFLLKNTKRIIGFSEDRRGKESTFW